MKPIDKVIMLNRLIEDGYFNQYQIDLLQNTTNTMPTVDIVRCKECKHHEQAHPGAIWCNDLWIFADEDWFCASGKREEE